jgi:cysteine desulfurase/selenocysteine lyase
MITRRSETHPDPYDVTRIREDFPALSVRVYENPLVYLDNAASAQKPNVVLDRMMQEL